MTATATEAPPQQLALVTDDNAPDLIAQQHRTMVGRIEDFVFFTTVMGMSCWQAGDHMGTSMRTWERWLEFLEDNPAHAAWHASEGLIGPLRHPRTAWYDLVTAGADPVAAALEVGAPPDAAQQVAMGWAHTFGLDITQPA